MMGPTRYAALASLIFATTSTATTDYEIRGQGTSSCGTWLEYRRDRDLLAFPIQAWLDGYITAFDRQWASENDHPLPDRDNNALYAWVDNYCMQNPLANINEAAGKLSGELTRGIIPGVPQPPKYQTLCEMTPGCSHQ